MGGQFCRVCMCLISFSTHRRRKVKNIGGGARFRILGGPGGGKFPAGTWRRTGVDATYQRRIDVISMSCTHSVVNKSVSNNYISHTKI